MSLDNLFPQVLRKLQYGTVSSTAKENKGGCGFSEETHKEAWETAERTADAEAPI